MTELQAVVLCAGSGSRMTEITDQNEKHLLPVAGAPLFWYPVNSLIRTGVNDIKLIFRETCESEVRKLLASELFKFECVNLEPIFINREDEEWGTADTIRHISSKLSKEKDLIICSGDFVSDAYLLPVIEEFRARKPDLLCVLSDTCVTGPAPGPKVKRSKGRDLIAIEEETNRLIYMVPEDDFDNAVDANLLLSKASKVLITTSLADCHVYFLRRSLLQNIAKNKNIASIKADFIPYILDCQSEKKDGVEPEFKCHAYILSRENGTVCAHANTLGSYFELTKIIPKSLCRISNRIYPGQVFDFKTSGISSVESWIDAGATVSNGAVIKKSSIADNCKLGEKARVQGSLLMNGVVLGKGALVSNSILCPGVVIEEKAEVVNCIVVNGQHISADHRVKDELVEGEEDEEADWADND